MDPGPDPRMAATESVYGSQRLGLPIREVDHALGRDNTWRSFIAPRLKTIQLDWATFQIMRRTRASLCRQAGIDPKLVADQLGHGLGVNLDVYTLAPLHNRCRNVCPQRIVVRVILLDYADKALAAEGVNPLALGIEVHVVDPSVRQ
jgi:hypothetical protein